MRARHISAGADPADESRPSRSLGVWPSLLAALLLIGLSLLTSNLIRAKEVGFTLLDHGAKRGLWQDGTVRGLALPPELRASLRSALMQNQLEVAPFVASLVGWRENLTGKKKPEERFHLLSPVQTAIDEPRPTFRWTLDKKATTYCLTIAPKEGETPFAKVYLPHDHDHWLTMKPLVRGEDYLWQVNSMRHGAVSATAPAPPLSGARFHVLSEAESAQLARTKSEVGPSHLGLALAYARAGLIDQAESEIAALQKENPASPIPSRLRTALQRATPPTSP